MTNQELILGLIGGVIALYGAYQVIKFFWWIIRKVFGIRKRVHFGHGLYDRRRFL